MLADLAFAYLLRNKRRTLTALGGVALAVGLILLIEGFATGIFNQATSYIDNSSADLFLGQRGADGLQNVVSLIPRSLEPEIAAQAGVRKVSSIYAFPLILEVGELKTSVTLYGYRRGSGMGGPWSFAAGRAAAADGEVVLDQVLAKQNRLGLGGEVRLLGQKFTVVGLSAKTNAYMNTPIFVTEDAVAGLLGAPHLVSFFLVQADKPQRTEDLKRELSRKFPQLSVLTRTQLADENTRPQLEKALGAPLKVIRAITFLVGLLVVGLTTYMAALERLKEYGVLKAIGAANHVLYRVVLTETLFFTALGFAAGLVLAWGSAWLIARTLPQFNIVFDAAALGKAAVMALVMSVVGAITPIRRVGSLDPARVFNS